ncbi:MAG: hypothetical protein FWD71_03855 [Oscillospiraceae bacterium]|nr:hypothetical protein [Oscillospiraceae bacterium]
MLKNKNLKIRPVLVSLAFCFSFIFSILLNSSVGADASAGSVSAAGSADDPLVTKSYIDKVVAQINQMISDKIAANPSASLAVAPPAANVGTVPAETSATAAGMDYIYPSQQDGTVDPAVVAAATYDLVQLTKDQKIRAKSGTLEMILRPGGTATVISSYQTQGIADLTTGNEILNNQDVPINHSLIIPRADGRGITVTSVTAYILVRGDYEIFE